MVKKRSQNLDDGLPGGHMSRGHYSVGPDSMSNHTRGSDARPHDEA
jgi:hypothetical protein